MLLTFRSNPLSAFKAAAGKTSVALLISAGMGLAQDLGSHTLPADLADSGAKVVGVLNKDPNNSARAMGYSEGPAVDADGNLFFTENQGSNGNIWKVTPDGQGSNFYFGPAQPNGLEFDPQGRLTACEKGAISTFDKAGNRTVLPNPGNVDLKQVNDLSIASDGGMWFTNHSLGNTYFYRTPAGVITSYTNVPPLGVLVPNGIEFIEEKKLLLVNSSDDNKVYQFDVSADRKPSNKRLFAPVPIPDGVTIDERGNVYIASYNDGAIYVFDPTGSQLLGKITVKGSAGTTGNTSNCVFGGPDGKTLYMTGNGGAYEIQLKVAGRKRPGSSSIVHGGLRNTIVTQARIGGFSAGYTLAGRKVAVEAPAALRIVTSPLFR